MAEAMAPFPIRALSPLDGRYHAGSGVALAPAPPRALVGLHVSDAAAGTVGDAIGCDLPSRPKTSVAANGLSVLWLGPGDLIVVADAMGKEAAGELIARIEASGTAEQSAVDVSDRFVALVVEGAAAEAVLAAGCPQDLRVQTFPAGAVSRTILARAEIVLWRRAENRFELLFGRSFADYVWSYLVEASRAPAV